jgi:hypothetical protein
MCKNILFILISTRNVYIEKENKFSLINQDVVSHRDTS